MDDDFLVALTRLAGGGKPPPVGDEHARFALYQSVRADPRRESDLLACLALDPDPLMAGSVLAEMLADADGPRRAALLAFVPRGNEGFLQRRAAELSVLDRLGQRAPDAADAPQALLAQVLEGSAWLQRRAVDHTNDRSILLALADRGRTKQVRHAARQQARTLGILG